MFRLIISLYFQQNSSSHRFKNLLIPVLSSYNDPRLLLKLN